MAGSPSNSTSDPAVPAHVVGYQFTKQYFTILHMYPEMVHQFYKQDGETEPDVGVAAVNNVLQSEINRRVMATNYRDFQTKITTIECEESHMGGVFVLVVGLIFHRPTARSENFVQSFFLAPQKNEPHKYFIRNDILWYLDRDLGKDKYQTNHNGSPVRDQSPSLTEGELLSSTQDELNVSGTFTSVLKPTIHNDIEAEVGHNGIEDSSQVHSTSLTNEPPVPPGEQTLEEASKVSPSIPSPAPPESVATMKEAPTTCPNIALSPDLPGKEASIKAPKSSALTASSTVISMKDTPIDREDSNPSPGTAPLPAPSESMETSKEVPTPSALTAISTVPSTEDTSKDEENSGPSLVTAPSPIPSIETLKEAPKVTSYASVVRGHQDRPGYWPPLATTGQSALKKEDCRANATGSPVDKQALNSSRSTSPPTRQGPVEIEASIPNVAAPPSVGKQGSNSSRPTSAPTGQSALEKKGSHPRITSPQGHPHESNSSLPACAAPVQDIVRGNWSQRSVFVANVPGGMSVLQLRQGLRRFGDIEYGAKGVIIFRREHYAFVTFEQCASAQAAIESSPVLVDGHPVRVEGRRGQRRIRNRPKVHYIDRSFGRE